MGPKKIKHVQYNLKIIVIEKILNKKIHISKNTK